MKCRVDFKKRARSLDAIFEEVNVKDKDFEGKKKKKKRRKMKTKKKGKENKMSMSFNSITPSRKNFSPVMYKNLKSP